MALIVPAPPRSGHLDCRLRTDHDHEDVKGQPHFVSNETFAGSQHDVVYVATENNSAYAIDACSGDVLVETNLGPAMPRSQVAGFLLLRT